MAIQATTEFAATSPEVTRAIVLELRKSDRKYKVFEAVYSGGQKPKDARLLAKKTRLTDVAVLQLATPMAHKQYFEQVKNNGRVAFKKYPHINAVKHSILRAAKSNKALRPPDESHQEIPGSAKRPSTNPRRPRSTWKSGPAKQKQPGKKDVFVSHASEDKDFVEPLVGAIKRAGITVWYDKDAMSWGDGLRASIDRGLAKSRFGIVVFSKAFLKKKHWTEHELDGLFAKERVGRKVILPIWHKITDRELLKYSPAFADRVAMISKRDSVRDIVRELKRLLNRG